jgi:hypothetical protein
VFRAASAVLAGGEHQRRRILELAALVVRTATGAPTSEQGHHDS